MKTAIICVKVESPHEQALLENQVQTAIAYCENKHFKVAKVFTEISTEQDYTRHLLNQLRQYLVRTKSTTQALVIPTYETLSTNWNFVFAMQDFLERLGIELIVLDEAKHPSELLAELRAAYRAKFQNL